MPVKITAAALRAIAPGAASDIVDGIVKNQHMLRAYGIDTPKRAQHFLGQCAVETAGFTRLEENLFYTTVARLRAVWPSRFPNAAAAQPYLRNPQRLANSVYGGRLGNTGPNDGWLFRGSGAKQTTGKYNFGFVERQTGLPVVEQPELLRRFPEALESACIYWRDNRLNRFADADDVVGLTRAIQGGSGGLADRRIYTDRAGRVDWETGRAPAAAAPAGDPILRLGARGKQVKHAQELLARHGHEILLDGNFGPGTDNIVRDFQRAHGLMSDGVIGPATWAALKAEPARTISAEDADPEIERVDKPVVPEAVEREVRRDEKMAWWQWLFALPASFLAVLADNPWLVAALLAIVVVAAIAALIGGRRLVQRVRAIAEELRA